MNKILFLSTFFCLIGCLQTRAELKSDAPSHQQKQAQEDSRFDDINRDFRQLNGRVEILENQSQKSSDGEKVKTLEAKINQLESKIGLLETTVAELNNKAKKDLAHQQEMAQKEKVKAEEEKNPLVAANKHFEDKKWEDAILAFENYRKHNPKAKNYGEVTYKIGQCFQNLGMKDDAKAFFKEVVDKFPSSKEAQQAKTKLKKL